MKRCTVCGQPGSHRARFCPRCGEALPARTGTPRSRARLGLGALTGLAGLAALAVIGASGDVQSPSVPRTASEVRLGTPVGGGDALGAGVELVAASPVGADDVLLLDTSRRLRRVGLPRRGGTGPDDGLAQRWAHQLDGAEPIEPLTGEIGPGARDPSLTVAGSLALVGDASGVSAVAVADGASSWRAQLPGRTRGPSYRVWRIGDDVMAANRFHLAVIEAASGAVRWSIERPPGDVQPIEGGLAVIAPDVVRAFTPAGAGPVWQLRRATPNRGAFGVVDRPAGPVVIDGRASVTLDPDDGRVLIAHGTASVVTRAGDATVVAAEWASAAGSPMLVGYAPDGTVRWRTPGPDLRCCELLLRPTQGGDVLAATIGRGRTEVGWLIDPTDGRISATVRRPSTASVLPLAVGDGTAVWLDGDELVGASIDTGDVRWRAMPGTVILRESPLLLGTPDGLVRP